MKILTDAYYSFFHCHLNYGILFWGNSAGAKDVFLLQKKALRILKGIGTRQSCRQVFVEMKILTVASLYVLACLTFIHNNKDNYTQLSEVHLSAELVQWFAWLPLIQPAWDRFPAGLGILIE